jgi:hypothetical protein
MTLPSLLLRPSGRQEDACLFNLLIPRSPTWPKPAVPVCSPAYNLTTSTATRQPKAAQVSVSKPAASKYLRARMGFRGKM